MLTAAGQPVVADGDAVSTWQSKGSATGYTLTRSSGTATYKPALFGTGCGGLQFNTFYGLFSDGTISARNTQGLTMFIVVSDLRGAPITARGSHFWLQSMGAYCHFNYFYLGAPKLYEPMGCATTGVSFALDNYVTNGYVPAGKVLYVVRADAKLNNVRLYVNNATTPVATVNAYGTAHLAATATCGSAGTGVYVGMGDFRLYTRRMEDAEFAAVFASIKAAYAIP